ncbi:MAG TPA: hypothetical protein VHW68_01305 [Actinomycetota bacterium]|jgi:hypothetical protein|nr:hypothetical protein [Actinomycetota bacterium]
MQRLQRSLIRIVKGPTGGFLASLGIAAVLGGVALATPAPPIASVPDHHPDVIAADPFGSYPTSNVVYVSSGPTPSGGVQTAADPTGRGPVLDPPGDHGSGNSRGASGSAGGGSAGGLRSAGATPAHHDGRDDPPGARVHHGQRHNRAGGHQGSGQVHSSGGQQGKGSGAGDSGSGGSGSGSDSRGGGRQTGGDSGPGSGGGGRQTGGTGRGGDSGGAPHSGSNPNARSTR